MIVFSPLVDMPSPFASVNATVLLGRSLMMKL